MAKVILKQIEGVLEAGQYASVAPDEMLQPKQEEELILSQAKDLQELFKEMQSAGGLSEERNYPLAFPDDKDFKGQEGQEELISYRAAISKQIADLFTAGLKRLKTFDGKTSIVNDDYIPHGAGDYFIDSLLVADSGAQVGEIVDPRDPDFEAALTHEKGGLEVLRQVINYIHETGRPNEGLAHLRRFLLPVIDSQGRKIELSDMPWDGERTEGQKYRRDVYAGRLEQMEKAKETIILSGKNEQLFMKLLEVFRNLGRQDLLIALHEAFKISAGFNIGSTGFYSYQKNLAVLLSNLQKHFGNVLQNCRSDELFWQIGNLISYIRSAQNYQNFAQLINNFVQKKLPELAGAKEAEKSEVTITSKIQPEEPKGQRQI